MMEQKNIEMTIKKPEDDRMKKSRDNNKKKARQKIPRMTRRILS